MLRLAHRGDFRRGPENSLEALLAGVAIPGCDGVELDVRVSRDGVPVLVHDETLARVQHRPGRVAELTAAQLAEAGVGELEAALRVLPRDAWLDVELKGDDHAGPTAGILRAARGDRPARAVISSFEPSTLAAMGDRLPGWARWLNAADMAPATLSLAVGLGCAGVSVNWGAITPAALRRANGAGLVVAAWVVRYRATSQRLRRLGIVAACAEGAALDG